MIVGIGCCVSKEEVPVGSILNLSEWTCLLLLRAVQNHISTTT